MREAPAVTYESDMTPWPACDGHPVVFLLDHTTRFERRLVEAWLHDQRPASRPAAAVGETEILSLRSGGSRFHATTLRRISALCSAAAPAFFVPLRMLWLPPHGERSARTGFAAFSVGGQRAPGSLMQRWLHRRAPSRARPIAAEGATLEALRRRYLHSHPHGSVDPTGLSQFIGRQAVLALERAEARVRGARYKVPRLVTDELLDRPALQTALERIAVQTRRTPGETRRYARACLEEMAAAHSTFYLDLMAAMGRHLYTRGFDPAIQVPADDVRRVRDLARHRPVVFLMTHKSHLDGFLMITMLRDMDVPPVHFFGGINMNLPGLGALGRRAGIVFIRRSFADDPAYKLVLRSYIDYLVEKRFPLLWALEGTRSRTGKLMPPRYGLLNYVVDSYARSAAPDVMLIPVAIVYDQVPEIADYVAEAKGQAKQPESASWFMKYVSGLRNPFGRIHVRFGAGVSLAGALGPNRDDVAASQLDLQKIAFQLAVQANAVTPVMASALVTFVLLARGHRALTFGALARELRTLVGLVRQLDLPTTRDIEIPSREVLETVLGQLQRTGVVEIHEDGITPVYAVPPSAAMAAAYCRNTCVHFFVPTAVAELALQCLTEQEGPGSVDAFRAEALRVRDLLKFEFFFDDKEVFLATIESDLARRAPDWQRQLSGRPAIEALLVSLDPLLAPGALRPFVEAYAVLADALLRQDATQSLSIKPFLKHCAALGQQRVRQRRVTSEESVSRAYFEPALKLAEHRGLLAGEAGPLRSGREQFAAECATLARRIDRLALLADQQRSTRERIPQG